MKPIVDEKWQRIIEVNRGLILELPREWLQSEDKGQSSEFVEEKGGLMNGEQFGVVMEEEKVEEGGGGNFLILLANLFFLIPTLIPKDSYFLSYLFVYHRLCSNMAYIEPFFKG